MRFVQHGSVLNLPKVQAAPFRVRFSDTVFASHGGSVSRAESGGRRHLRPASSCRRGRALRGRGRRGEPHLKVVRLRDSTQTAGRNGHGSTGLACAWPTRFRCENKRLSEFWTVDSILRVAPPAEAFDAVQAPQNEHGPLSRPIRILLSTQRKLPNHRERQGKRQDRAGVQARPAAGQTSGVVRAVHHAPPLDL